MFLEGIKKYIKNNLLLIILFAILCIVELFFIFPLMMSDYINYDSSYQYALTQHTFPEIWELLQYDYSPPFYAIALKLFTMVFGNDLITMRIFSAIAVVGMYFIASFPINEIFGKKSAVAALLLTFFSPAIYNMIHEIRPTIFGMFFFMASAIYMLYAYSLEKRHGYICGTVFSVLAMYTHNIALVGVFGVFVTILLFSLLTKNYKKFINFLISGIICAVAYLPWLGVILNQISNVNDNFWISTVNVLGTIDWVIWGGFPISGLSVTLKMFCALSIFGIILRHIKLKELKNVKKFGDAFILADDKKVYRDITLLFLFILVPFVFLMLINHFFRNLASQRYYFIFGVVWIILFGIIIGRFGNKILSVLILVIIMINYINMNYQLVQELKEADMDEIVSDIYERESGGDIAFLHLHEWTLGEMTYYFPDATHYVCDQTFTVLGTYDVFPNNIVDIGDISNICNYTDEVYVFTNRWKFNSTIPVYTPQQLLGDREDVTISTIRNYHIAYPVSAKEMMLAELVFDENDSSEDNTLN